MRSLTAGQERVLDFVEDNLDVSISETAAGLEVDYGTAQRSLTRLAKVGLIERATVGNRVYFRKLQLEQPDSTDPLEKLFCL